MILVISPAKRLNFSQKAPVERGTTPCFIKEAARIMETLRGFSAGELSRLLNLGDKLAQTSWERHQNWSEDCRDKRCKQAVYAYTGDVYQGLQPGSFSEEQIRYMQDHLIILSSLYGILRPLDYIQPYRLQMDAAISIEGHKDLYGFWKEKINELLISRLDNDPGHTLVNLASDEYFRVVNPAEMRGKIIKPVFKQYAGGTYRVVSFHAKRARGMMCRFIIENRLTDPEHLKLFDRGNYIFSPEESDDHRWVFIRG